MREGAAFRGQPLLVLAGLVLGWAALRLALWEPLPAREVALAPSAPARTAVARPRFGATGWRPEPRSALPDPRVRNAPSRYFAESALAGVGPLAPSPGNRHPFVALSALRADRESRPTPPPAQPSAAPLPVAPPLLPAQRNREARWSADAWVMLRQDTTTPILSGRPSYGRSQAGAIVRYRLATGSALRPEAYLRASAALSGARDEQVAAGLSARLIPRVPVRFALEARAERGSRGTHVTPAAYAVTELPPVRLPLGARGEVYAQAGYVAGEWPTAFADGQARLDKPIVRRGDAEFSLGAGAWGGAQEGAARLDVGPTASVSFPLRQGYGRVAGDYRFRVAGDAEPSSGPALTLSAGF